MLGMLSCGNFLSGVGSETWWQVGSFKIGEEICKTSLERNEYQDPQQDFWAAPGMGPVEG